MIGIDIGSKFIKVCQMDVRGDEVRDIYSVVRELKERKGSVSRAAKETSLKKILEKGRFTSREAVFSVGSQEAIIRTTEFPMMPEPELKNSIKFNAEKYIYTDLGGMDMDICIMSKSENKQHVLVAAVPGNVVDEKMEIVQNAGCYAESADIDTIALINCFRRFNKSSKEDEKNVVLVNIGHKVSGVAVLNENGLCFAKNVGYGGSGITAEIAKMFDIDERRAEKLKKAPKMWVKAGLNIKSVLRRSTPDLIENLHRSIEYCRSNNLLDSVDRVYLTGGGAMVEGITEIIGGILGIDTVLWNPLKNLKTDMDKSNGPLLGVVIGLALREYV